MMDNDLRRWMTLVEAAVPFSPEAYEIINDYVTHGTMTTAGQFDTQFDTLMRLLRRPTRGLLLYRVLILDVDQIAQIQSGGLSLENRRYASWTKSPKSLDRLIYDRQKGVGGTKLAVIKANVSPEQIVVDVAAFYQKYHLTSGDYGEWDRYVRPEQEVIVQQNGAVHVTPEMLVEVFAPDSTDSGPPKPGQAFIATNGKRDKMTDLADADEQPGGGLYAVITVDGDLAFIRRNRTGKWVEVDH